MLWNKINVNSNITLDNDCYLEITSDVKLNIIVRENVCAKLVIIGNNNYDINLELDSGSNLIVNSLNKDNCVNVNINLRENSNITYNHSSLSIMNSINNFNVNHMANNSVSNLNNNGINFHDGKLVFVINGIVSKNLTNITCNQKSKIIEFDKGNSKIIPNLIIDSNDIIASHSAFIGKIDDEEKFYMQSRGISEKDILKIVYQVTLLGMMDLSKEKEEFNKRINEWW